VPFMVLVYGPLGGYCNYTPVAQLTTSTEVCGTPRAKPEWLQYIARRVPAVLCRSSLEHQGVAACSHSANG
jgi:hypothetical protein